MVMTHAHRKPSTSPDGRGAAFSHVGSRVDQGVLQQHDNVFLVLSGHEHGVDIEVRRDVGTPGNNIVELLADYQFYEVSAEELGLRGNCSPTPGNVWGANMSVSARPHVNIVGSGPNGLTAAAILARAGRQVRILNVMTPWAGLRRRRMCLVTARLWIWVLRRIRLVWPRRFSVIWGWRTTGWSGCTPSTRWLTRLMMRLLRFCIVMYGRPRGRWVPTRLLGG